MTQLRKHKDAISNYFDSVLSGIGHRGSSFMDMDAVTHDARTKRWLVQEFKHEGEPLNKGEHWMLQDLSDALPQHFTVWFVVKCTDGTIGWADFRERKRAYRKISIQEYQGRFRAWWEGRQFTSTDVGTVLVPEEPVVHASVERMLTDADMNW